MQNTTTMNDADGLGFVLAMGWVIILMAATILSASVQRKNERKQYAQVGATKMYGIGLEIEAIKASHAENAPNQKIAHWLNLQKAKDAPGAFKRFLSFVQAQNAKARRTRAAKRAYLRSVRKPTEQTAHTHQSSEWMSGRTTGGITRVTTDGSLSTGGFEVVSPPLAPQEVTAWILETVEPLRTIATINRTTGLHAHIALRKPAESFGYNGVMSETEAKSIGGRVAYAWSYFWHDLKRIFPVSRWDNSYAQATDLHKVGNHPHDMEFTATSHLRRTYNHTTDEYEMVKHTGDTHYGYLFDWQVGHGRYQHLNLKSMFSRGFGTIEFRAHQGTVNPMKISRWVEFCTRFVAACEDETNYIGFFELDDLPSTRDAMWAFMDLEVDHHIRDYYEKRAFVLHGVGTPTMPCMSCGSTRCVHGECEVFIDRADAVATFNDLTYNTTVDLSNTRVHCSNDACGSSIPASHWVGQYHRDYLQEFFAEHNHGDYMTIPAGGDEIECPYCGDTDLVMGSLYTDRSYEMGGLAVFMLGLAVTAPLVGAVALLVGCGIGLIHSGSVKGNNAKKASTRLFSGLSSRGNQAAGAAWFNTTDGEVYYQKSPTSSVALAPKLLKKYFSKATTWMMMHTRYATHGKNTADNAHPHFGPKAHVTLVHNGVVHNYDKVWEALDAKQTGPVDSQAVAACLEAGGIEKVVELCEGSMSLIWSDSRDPVGTLKFWTNGGNPLHAGRLDSETGIIVVASTEKHLHDAYGKRLYNDWACAIGKEYTISTDGVITSRHIEGSADTAGISYDWRTYASWNRTPAKATGDSDTCAIGSVNVASIQLIQYEWDDMGLNDAIDNAYNEMLGTNWNTRKAMYYQSWPADAVYHGFDGQSHMGIRPDGSKYDLPLRWQDGKDMSPDLCSDTMAMVLSGLFDPDLDDELVKVEPVDEFDMEWHDIIATGDDTWYTEWS